MPAKSKAQQAFMGAELARRRAGKGTVTGMTTEQLRDFAATKRKGLPKRKKPNRYTAEFSRRMKS